MLATISGLVQGHAVAAIVIGTLFIGLGGLMTTLGWNAISSAENLTTLRAEEARRIDKQRNALLLALGLEVEVNRKILAGSEYSENDPAALSRFVVFPPTQKNAIAAAIASGLFVGDVPSLELYRTIAKVQILISHLDATINATTQDMFRVSNNRDEQHRLEEISKLRTLVRDSAALKETRAQLDLLANQIAEARKK